MKTWLATLPLLVLLACAGDGPTPSPPFGAPAELKAALKAALQAQDTNAFWALHCWTNVTPEDEAWHKRGAFNQNFKQSAHDQMVYTSFSIKAVDPGLNMPVPDGPGRLRKFNIPVTGVITFTAKGTSPSDFGGEPMRFRNDNGVYFGKSPDGHYWLAVGLLVPRTNTPAAR